MEEEIELCDLNIGNDIKSWRNRKVSRILIVLLALCIANLVIGAFYLDDCSMENLVPIFLIVHGCSLLFTVGILKRILEEKSSPITPTNIIGIFGLIVNTGLLISGSQWLYPTFGEILVKKNVACTDTLTDNCTNGTCNELFLKLAYSVTTLDWGYTGFCWSLVICPIKRKIELAVKKKMKCIKKQEKVAKKFAKCYDTAENLVS